MNVEYVAQATLEQLLNFQDGAWAKAAVTTLPLAGTPVTMQPTAAVRNSWQIRPIGAIDKVAVRALHNGRAIAFHLSWIDPNHNTDHGDNSTFPDSAAIAFPLAKDAPLLLMGAPNLPLSIWYWRADSAGSGFQVRAEGPGTTQIVDKQHVRTHSGWQGNTWNVVIARALQTAEAGTIGLKAGQATQFGIAVWEGAHGERGGLKATSGDWQSLTIAGK